MNAVTSRRRTRSATRDEGLETVAQDLNHPAVDLLAKYLALKWRMKAPTYVSLNRKVTALLGYWWICKPGSTIPETREEVECALNSGKLKAAVQPPLRLIEKPTRFAKALRRDKTKGYKNCVNLMRYLGGRHTIFSPRRSVGSMSPFCRFHTDDGSINVDGNGDHRLLSISSDPATTIHACL
ncbi:MAG: hypothetical protein M1840_004037 [Geoglossum simile]|nr:MAG: hypothetical protein M1840_004037 [Geoglossum simile]